MTKQKFGLTGTALKTIALVLMVMDHIHYFFEFTGVVPEWFSMLARLSAPLFLFCTVEGFAHTHDRRRYFLRIWAIGTAMGTVEFFMIYARGLPPRRRLLPAECHFSGSDAALHHLAGHRLAAPAPVCAGRTGCCHADSLADLHRSAADAFSQNSGRTDRLCRVGVGHHRAAAFVDIHHRRRLVLFWPGASLLYALYNAQAPAAGRLGGCDLPV